MLLLKIPGNIMNFERPKFNARQENRIEALKAFKKKCGYIFKGSLVNISEERKCILVQDWIRLEGQKIYDSLDWGELEDVNNYDLQDLNTTFRPVLSLYDEKTQIQTLGTRKCFLFNPATGEEGITQFRIVAEDLTPVIGLSDSEELKLIELLRENIATLDSGKPNVPSSASELHTPLTLQAIQCKYPEVFENCVGKLDGELHLYTKQDVTPTKAAPREIPLSVKNKFIAEVKDLQEQGIIEKVTAPTDWVSAPTIVNKPSAKNGIRLCIDSRPLNTALKRSEYPIPTIDYLLTEISNAKVFALADIKSAFWHVPLDEPSSLLTTFNTPLGRMKWNRMPFGISVAPEEFQRRIDESLEELDGTKAIADDILIWGDGNTIEEATSNHDARLSALLDRCQQKHIKLNADKFQLRKTELSYMGVTLTNKGVKPDPRKQDSMQAMPAPTKKEEVRRLLGVVTYLSRSSEDLSTKSEPLRMLLKKDVAFTWEVNEQHAFDEIKSLISSAPLLKYFNPDLPVEIQTDASSSGLGACLTQGGQPVQYASRALTETEKRYSQIEEEMLSVVFGLTRFHTYTYGRKVTVYNDHKPLAAVLKRPVGENPIRLQRMLCRIMGYDLDFMYIKGKDLLIADALSRSLMTNHTRSQREEEIETIGLVIQDQSVTSHLKEISEATATDNVLQSVISLISENWPISKRRLLTEVLPFWSIKDQLSFHVLVDYYSDWIEFDKMRDQTATETIALLLKQFSRWGLPDEIVTDCGKNFDSKEFSQFCQRKQIRHKILATPSPEQWQSRIRCEDHQSYPEKD